MEHESQLDVVKKDTSASPLPERQSKKDLPENVIKCEVTKNSHVLPWLLIMAEKLYFIFTGVYRQQMQTNFMTSV